MRRDRASSDGRGLNLIDTAPGYEDGYSEQIVGRALQGRHATWIFVIDKIDDHDAPVAPQVEKSLVNLKIDRTDLFVFHGLSEIAKWKRIAGPGGGMEQLDACRKAGKLRFRGISSHHPDVLRAAILSGLCDVVMFAIGPYCNIRYVTEILPLAKKHGVGSVCFKTSEPASCWATRPVTAVRCRNVRAENSAPAAAIPLRRNSHISASPNV